MWTGLYQLRCHGSENYGYYHFLRGEECKFLAFTFILQPSYLKCLYLSVWHIPRTNHWFLFVSEFRQWRKTEIFERVVGSDVRHRCTLCGKVVTHMRNHYYVHFPGQFSCQFCGAVYARSDSLFFHIKNKHSWNVHSCH
jgi:hypothetical protein